MIAIFNSLEELNTIIETLPSGVTIGSPTISNDGRVAISHSFNDDDINVLINANAVILEELPIDWNT